MELFVEQGETRMDCELKIASRFNRPFRIMTQKEIRIGGFMGLFSKPGVQVEYYFTPQYYKKPAVMQEHSFIQPEEDLETRKRKLIAAAGKDPDRAMQSGKEAADQIINALNELKEKLENTAGKNEHPSFAKAAGILRLNDFSESYINSLMERMKKELSLEKLEDFDTVQEHLLEWIGESISIYKEDEIMRKPRIFILIGPTGVGKTTTIAKLAAFYGIGPEAVDVRMITIDAYRIGAREQLEKIGNIMQIPVSFADAETPEQAQQVLRKEIAIHKYIDMFFVDTIGKSPKDASKIGEMKIILDGAGRNAEFHLAVSAATKASDIENILRQFEPFNYKSVLLTKMDETEHVGNIISVLAEKRKSISYITDGQAVPSDIKKASVVRFLINLDGFKINREKIEKRFPPGDADQFKWR
ncbi:MAG: flagellar biosynthesis protein FlhF [Treponema sp.]|jgi:flagellar biosynthesis protein FlhF|nr:flagellar biosynthesis protein FlhF [Treponema sp.]